MGGGGGGGQLLQGASLFDGFALARQIVQHRQQQYAFRFAASLLIGAAKNTVYITFHFLSSFLPNRLEPANPQHHRHAPPSPFPVQLPPPPPPPPPLSYPEAVKVLCWQRESEWKKGWGNKKRVISGRWCRRRGVGEGGLGGGP